MTLNEIKALSAKSGAAAREGSMVALANSKLREQHAKLQAEIDELQKDTNASAEHLKVLTRASALLASVSEKCTNQILDAIIEIINKALRVLFPNDPKSVEISRSLYRETHPHYTLLLKTSQGVPRAFNLSGTGLGQIVSFMFTVCLIDARKGRKILVMDELLNGLHPSAKKLVADMMKLLAVRSHEPFQFICTEYGMDVGKEYEVAKGQLEGGLATVTAWEGLVPYYASQALEAQQEEGGAA